MHLTKLHLAILDQFAQALAELQSRSVDNTPNSAIPLTWISSHKLVSSSLRLFLRTLPFSQLPYEQRYEYSTGGWWTCASHQLLLLVLNDPEQRFEVVYSTDTSSSHDEDEEEEREGEEGDSAVDGTQFTVNSLRSVLIQFRSSDIWTLYTSGSRSRGAKHNASTHQSRAQSSANVDVDDEEGELEGGNMTRVEACPPQQILLRTNSVIVLNKDSGVSMDALLAWTRSVVPVGDDDDYPLRTVSRLDQPTSGAVIIPTTAASEKHLTEQFKSASVDKWYVCIVSGIAPLEGTVSVKLRYAGGATSKSFAHPDGKKSITHFRRLDVLLGSPTCGSQDSDGAHDHQCRCVCGDCYSVVLCKPVTGRTHQIRAHMSHIGHPLLGDKKYGRRQHRCKSDVAPRLMLHSHVLCFDSVFENSTCYANGPLETFKDETLTSSGTTTRLTITADIPAAMVIAISILKARLSEYSDSMDAIAIGLQLRSHIETLISCFA